MRKSRFMEEQIVSILQEHEADPSTGFVDLRARQLDPSLYG